MATKRKTAGSSGPTDEMSLSLTEESSLWGHQVPGHQTTGLKHAGEVLQDVDGFFQHRMLLGKFFSPAELTSCLDHQQNKSQ
tara:strand:- start:462 stop:707 length:246 start_codon:yes stop_codon:yes gene_type:complete